MAVCWLLSRPEIDSELQDPQYLKQKQKGCEILLHLRLNKKWMYKSAGVLWLQGHLSLKCQDLTFVSDRCVKPNQAVCLERSQEGRLWKTGWGTAMTSLEFICPSYLDGSTFQIVDSANTSPASARSVAMNSKWHLHCRTSVFRRSDRQGNL